MAAIKRLPIDKYTIFACDFDSTSTSGQADGTGTYPVVLVGTPTIATDLLGDSTSHALTCASGKYGKVATLLNTGAKQWTIEFFCNVTTLTTNMRFFSKILSNGSATSLIDLSKSAASKLFARISQGFGLDGVQSLTSSTTIPTATLFYCAVTCGPRGIELWMNTTKEDSLATVWTAHNGVGTDLNDFGIGASDDSNFSSPLNLTGIIDSIRISNVQRTKAEIQANAGLVELTTIPWYRQIQYQPVSGTAPLITATLATEGTAVYEPSMFDQPAGLMLSGQVMGIVYTGSYGTPSLHYAEWNNGLLRKAGRILGQGTGSQTGTACRGNAFRHTDNNLYVTYADAVGATGNICLGKSTDNGTTWAKVGQIIAHDANASFDGCANTSTPLLINGTYYMLVEVFHSTYWTVVAFKTTDATFASGWTYHCALTLPAATGGSAGSPTWFINPTTQVIHIHHHRTPSTGFLPTYLTQCSITVANFLAGTDTIISTDDTPTRNYLSSWEVNQDADPHILQWLGQTYFAFDGGYDAGQTFAIFMGVYNGSLLDAQAGIATKSTTPVIQNVLVPVPFDY